MLAQLILWSHALAALAFGAVAPAAWQRPHRGWPRGFLVAALMLSALWALAVAGIGTRDLATRCAGTARDLGWLVFALALVRRDRSAGWTLHAVYLVVGGVVVIGGGLAVAATVFRGAARLDVEAGTVVFRMMAAAGALVLARHLHGASPEGGAMRLIAVALALIWGADLAMFGAIHLTGDWSGAPVAVGGAVAAIAALLVGFAVQRRDGWSLAVSRPAASRALIAVAVVVYAGLAACLAAAVGVVGGEHGRAWSTGVAIGAAAALLTLLSTSWLGAWARVKLVKHLFAHRYDYRVEWQRFTATLGGGDATLDARVVAAMATLLDAPTGSLLLADDEGLAASSALARHLADSRRVVEIDAVRAGTAPADAAALPASMIEAPDAWALVPLIHGDALVGAVLLNRPPVPRALDWEDFDLLRVAGRQAASYLAEDRAHRALAQAARFDEFNRRFAFILHDVKNLASQQLLVARNAERHAANPAFQADMVATLNESAERMIALLARLAPRELAPAEGLASVDCGALVERLAWLRRTQHPLVCETVPGWALAHPQRLEQVLAHLVQNAVEASAVGVTVTVRVIADGAQVVVEIVDRGCGMSAGFIRDELFRPFSSTKPGGFGIGAFEARQLVVAMAGRLTVTSREGEGSCFRVALPAAAACKAAA